MGESWEGMTTVTTASMTVDTDKKRKTKRALAGTGPRDREHMVKGRKQQVTRGAAIAAS